MVQQTRANLCLVSHDTILLESRERNVFIKSYKRSGFNKTVRLYQ